MGDELAGLVDRAGEAGPVGRRLLGLDRFGVRFRVQGRSGCYDLRVPFAGALDGVDGFAAAVDHLLTCGPA
ncbi:hypothetical protein [Blastococcus sp. SYSU DS0533]